MNLEDALNAVIGESPIERLRREAASNPNIRNPRLAVCVYGASRKKNATDWHWKCEGCGETNTGLNKEQAGWQANKHMKRCIHVYSYAERQFDAEIERLQREQNL